ncbi:MAG: hypothetical protein ACOC04_03195 [Halothece sp.]
MNYLIAVLPNEAQAQAASSALVKTGLTEQQVTIVGEGYKSPDDIGLAEPNQEAGKQSFRLLYWLVPFGFLAGFAFNILSGIDIFPVIGRFGNATIGGILGAASGALGALVVGGVVGWTVSSGDALAYRNRVNAGKYLVVVQASENITRQATKVLRQFDIENIQGYSEPVSA